MVPMLTTAQWVEFLAIPVIMYIVFVAVCFVMTRRTKKAEAAKRRKDLRMFG